MQPGSSNSTSRVSSEFGKIENNSKTQNFTRATSLCTWYSGLTFQMAFADYYIWFFSASLGLAWQPLVCPGTKLEFHIQRALIRRHSNQEFSFSHLIWKLLKSISAPIGEILTEIFNNDQNGKNSDNIVFYLLWKPGLGWIFLQLSFLRWISRFWELFQIFRQQLNFSIGKVGKNSSLTLISATPAPKMCAQPDPSIQKPMVVVSGQLVQNS